MIHQSETVVESTQIPSEKVNFINSIFKIKTLLLIVFLFVSIIFLGYLSSFTLLKIDMDSASSSTLEVFWADEGQSFNIDQLEKTATQKGRQTYWFLIKDYKKNSLLRIDPARKGTSIKIYEIKLLSIRHGVFDVDFFDILHTNDIEGIIPRSPWSAYAEIETIEGDSQIEIQPILVRPFVTTLLFLMAILGFLFPRKYYLQAYQALSEKVIFINTIFKIKTLFIVVMLFVGMVFLGYLSSLTLLKIDMDSANSSTLEVFWMDEHQPFTGDQLEKTATQKGRQTYWFLMKDYKKYSYLRIDPAVKKTSIKIHSITLFSIQHGMTNIDFFNDIINSKDISGLLPQMPDFSYSAIEIRGDDPRSIDPQIIIRPIYERSIITPLLFLVVIVGFLFPRKYYLQAYLLLFSAVFLYYFFSFNETQLSFRASSERDAKVNVFWQYKNKSFSNTKARTVAVEPGTHNYKVKTGNFSNIEALYIDEGKDWQRIIVDELKIEATGYEDFSFNLKEIVVEKERNTKALLIPLSVFLLVCVLVTSGIYFAKNRRLFYFKIFPKLVSVLFLFVLFLVINLVWQSDFHMHPDEHAHIECLEYFSDHWEFPKVGDSRSEDSYQEPWALSRLDDLGISYFLAGKFRNIAETVFENKAFGDRAFNVLLFFMFFVLGKNKRQLLFLAPLLCSPQIWYLYSYTNRGAFVLFISLLLAWQLVNKKSYLNIYLKEDNPLSNWKYCLFPSLLLGVVSIEQTNYILFILFVFSMLLWRLLSFVENKKKFIYKCLIFMMMGSSIFVIRKGIDISINGFNKQEQRIAYAEEHAGAEFKPSIATSKDSYHGLRLRDKGIGMTEMFKPEWNWHKMTFQSFAGFYGYYMEYSPKWYYFYVLLIYALVLLVFIKHAIFQENWKYNLFSALSLTAVSGGILMGLLFSWLHDFQPQGRYIFPIIPIIIVYCGVMLPRLKRLDRSVMLTCFMALVLLSLYSFNKVALNYLIA